MVNKESKDTAFSSNKTLNLKGKILDLGTPKVMGILNVTPDSFYDGGAHLEEKDMIEQVGKMLQAGATFIDIGGYSSRPGADNISEEEESNRVLSALRLLLKQFPKAFFSIDTFRASVARKAVDEGAVMINDISGGRLDATMLPTVAEVKVPYVLMHSKGDPQTMRSLATYEDLITEITDFFVKQTARLREFGVSDVILDPGFGFAKTVKQNYELLKNLKYFQGLKLPVLIGLSRKSMIYKSLKIEPSEALNGTTALNTIGLMNGASILRVHDVKEAVEAIELYKLTYA